MIPFLLGVAVGGTVGAVVMALLVAAADDGETA